MSISFSSRSNAKRAALKTLGASAVEAEDYKLAQATDGRWNWTSLKDSPGDSPSAISEARRHPRAKGEMRTSESRNGSARKIPHSPKEAGAGKVGTKQEKLIAMLRAADGATVAEIAATFGWQPHTVRGAIAGALKKKLGLEVTSDKADGRGRVYRIGA